MLSLVVAASENGVIGRGGAMPWHLPADLAHFKCVTMGKPIVMGRRTFEAIGRALPGRRNIVVTRRGEIVATDVETAASLGAALELAGGVPEVMVIGGGEIFREALPLAERIYLTRIRAEIEGDTFFPELDAGEWRETARAEHTADEKNPYPLSFITLERTPRTPTFEWSYSGATGPEHWHRIAPVCATGRRQSPINLDSFTAAALAPLRFAYDVRATEAASNGHAIAIRFAPGGTLEANGRTFTLDHLHFHVPAEHRIEGRAYALEAHFVNTAANGRVAVVALLCNAGAENAGLAKIIPHLPIKAGEKAGLDGALTAADFLPDDRDYYHYDGSLTTPPCTEGVSWFVLRSPLSAAENQAQALKHAVGGPNNRPLQARNDRKILVGK